MNARVAEALVRKWQHIKSQAFGPDHCLVSLQEVRNLTGPLKWIWLLVITLFQFSVNMINALVICFFSSVVLNPTIVE